MMPQLSMQSRPHVAARLSPRLWGRIKLSSYMELPEMEFRKLLGQLESDPLFKKLSAIDKPERKIFSRRPFANTDLSSRFYELNEQTMAGSASPDASELLEKWQDILAVAQKIGADRFKRYFLQEAGESIGVKEIAKECAISAPAVKALRQMVDAFCIQDLACPTLLTATPRDPEPTSTRIATIEKDLTIGYCPAQYARGRYAINYKKLYQLRVEGRFSKGEFQHVKGLIKNIELANMRLTILYRILTRITETQRDYLLSGREEDMRPLTQQMLAKQLGVHRSTINRAITRKFIDTPLGETRSLKFFLGNSKRFVKSLLAHIQQHPAVPGGLSDEMVRKILDEKHGVRIARRTICAYRHELKAVGERG